MPLIDRYDVYQHLMDYWETTMQDDAYLISDEGWKAVTYRIIEKDKKGKEKDKGWTCDLVPKSLVVARYFAKEQAALEELNSRLEAVSSRLAEIEEEQGGEEGAFSELEKITKASVAARLKEIANDKDSQEEAAVLSEWMKLDTEGPILKKQLKDREVDLDLKAYKKYPTLTQEDIRQLVVDDKWMAAIESDIHGEMDRISQRLTARVKELAERYETPMPELAKRVCELEAKVNGHLERMGFKWM
jgi:type I restriction enzyme M protein